jgi:hypothetical protein
MYESLEVRAGFVSPSKIFPGFLRVNPDQNGLMKAEIHLI